MRPSMPRVQAACIRRVVSLRIKLWWRGQATGAGLVAAFRVLTNLSWLGHNLCSCSSGSHRAGQSVTWTGVANVRRKALGVKLNWLRVFLVIPAVYFCFFCARAYAPGEFKVLVSSDGGNFEEAACWRTSSRNEVSYEETVLFSDVRSVQAVTVVMKSPMPWNYFGLNDVALLTSGEESFMIVNGAASPSGEQCLAVSGRGLSSQACLDTISAGDGRDVFRFQGDQLVHAATGMCVALSRGGGDRVGLEDCAVASRAQDGRASWQLTSGAQLKLGRMGNYCLNVVAGDALAADCGEAAGGESSDKFLLAVVAEVDPSAAGAAKDQAALLSAAAGRQRRVLNDLQAQLPALGACKFAASLALAPGNFSKALAPPLLAARKLTSREEAAVEAIGRIYSAIGLDIADVARLIGESSSALEATKGKLAHSA